MGSMPAQGLTLPYITLRKILIKSLHATVMACITSLESSQLLCHFITTYHTYNDILDNYPASLLLLLLLPLLLLLLHSATFLLAYLQLLTEPLELLHACIMTPPSGQHLPVYAHAIM